MNPASLALPTVPPPGRFFDAGLGLMVILLMTIATSALVNFGWQYAETGGSALEKIHPATLVAVAVLLMSLACSGNPIRALSELLAARPNLTFYLLAVGLMILHSLRVVERPFTIFIDTFLLPAVLYMLLCGMSEERGRFLARLTHTLILVNGVLGLSEFVFGFRTFPIVIEGVELEQDAEWRSSALLGHPLSGSIVFGSYILMLVMGGARDLATWLRPFAFIIAIASMVVFGGRAASAFLLFMLSLLAARRLTGVMRGAYFDKRSIMAGLIVLPIAGIVVLGLAEAGFFDRFIDRLSDDEGSASTRIAMFDLLKHLSWHDLSLLPDQAVISTWMTIYGLDYGIESFWLSMVLAHGLFVAVFFFIALFIFCREVISATGRGATSVFVYFFAVASTSLSLSAKTTLFSIFVMLVLILLRRTAPVEQSFSGARSPRIVPLYAGG